MVLNNSSVWSNFLKYVTLAEGDQVEGNRSYNGWRAGKIARDRGDGTYDISYDDGKTEEGVTEDKIRLQGSLKTCDYKYQPNYRNINLRRIVEGSHHLLHAGKDYFNDAINELCDIDNICAFISAGKYTIITSIHYYTVYTIISIYNIL